MAIGLIGRLAGRFLRGGLGGGGGRRQLALGPLMWHPGTGSVVPFSITSITGGIRVSTAPAGWFADQLGDFFDFDRFMDVMTMLVESQVLPRVRARLPNRTGRLAESLRVERDGAGIRCYSVFYGAYQRPSAREAFVQELTSQWPALVHVAFQEQRLA